VIMSWISVAILHDSFLGLDDAGVVGWEFNLIKNSVEAGLLDLYGPLGVYTAAEVFYLPVGS
jgi:hypothetical protein